MTIKDRLPSAAGRCLGAVFFVGAAVIVLRLGYAELLFRQDSPEAIRGAARLDGLAAPARYYEKLSEVDPAQSAPALLGAIEADPRSSEARIALGLEAERDGRFPYASVQLLEAARLDRQYLPAWTLANFYFRRGDDAHFWDWAQRAASLCYDDFRPLLALAHRLASSPGAVLARLGGGLRLMRADLDYLAQQKQFDAAQQVARSLHSAGDESDRPRFIELADRQIQAGNGRYAVELWNMVLPPLDPAGGRVLTNGDLAREPLGKGFDWRLGATDGMTAQWRDGTVVFSLSGAQPEACELMTQTLPSARAARVYRLKFQYAIEGFPAASGLRWELDGVLAPALESRSSTGPQDAFRKGSAVFPARRVRDSGLSRLRLIYVREPGSVNAEGRLTLRSIALEVPTA